MRQPSTPLFSLPSWIAVPLLLFCLVPVVPAFAGTEEEAPVATATPPRADLHLSSHVVSVVLNNGFATTQVDQVLTNPTAADVSAEWAFPLPQQASLSELALWIDGEKSVGEVVAKEEGRRIHQAEAAAGQDAALAEQNSYFDYRIALTRVPARGEVKVRVLYYQPLDIDQGVGRYLYPLQDGKTDDMKASFWTMDKAVDGELRFDVTLKTSFPVDGLHCPSHPGFTAALTPEGDWRGTYRQTTAKLDTDFVLYYRLRPDVPARVEVLTHRRPGDAEGTFMAVVTPGSDLAPITEGRDWVFVLDTSGSMQGEKIRMLRKGVTKALAGLGPNDRVQLVEFKSTARRLTADWVPMTPEGLPIAAGHVSSLRAGGSTNLHAALDMAYGLLDADRLGGVLLVSDGVANTGLHHYRDFLTLMQGHDVRLFTFVMGNGANYLLLSDMATWSGGFAKTVSVQDEIGAHLLLARERMGHEALHGIEFRLEGATVQHPHRLPSLYLGQQLVVFGRYDRVGPSTLEVSAKISGEPTTWRLPIDLPAENDANPELERLYALAAITDLEREAFLRTGDAGEAAEAVRDMAIRYSLVTDQTSMIVVRQDRKALYGIGDANRTRRAAEQAAADRRATGANTVSVHTGGTPLAGRRAAHAPSRAAGRQGGGGSGGGGGGAGAVGPLYLLAVAGLGLLAARRRRRRGAEADSDADAA